MYDWYQEIYSIMGELEADEAIIETMVLNGKNEKANRYLRGSIPAIRHVLSILSDAEFEVVTSPRYDDEDDDFDPEVL